MITIVCYSFNTSCNFALKFGLRTKESKGDALEWRTSESGCLQQKLNFDLSYIICYDKYYNMYGRHHEKSFQLPFANVRTVNYILRQLGKE